MKIRTVPILWNGRETGSVAVREEGLYIRFEAKAFLTPGSIYRAYLCFERGERLLGVLEPYEHGMRCVRCFAKQQIRAAGELKCAILRTKEENQWRRFDGKLLPRAFTAGIATEDALQRADGERVFLALPYSEKRPFPLTELFCLASIREINGGCYAVYTFSKDGIPKI